MLQNLLRLFYPRKCPGCGTVIPADVKVCPDCRDRFKKIEPPWCLKCGRHIADEASVCCDDCAKSDRSFDYGISVFLYDSFMQDSIGRFKFEGWQENADFYCEEMAEYAAQRIKAFAPEALIPVPVHKNRMAQRGYNQAELLADGIGERLGIPVVTGFLVRKKDTSFQKTLSPDERLKNIKEAFYCETDGSSAEFMNTHRKRVMLVDDIFTTGSTIESCALTLKQAGIIEVGFISLSIVAER